MTEGQRTIARAEPVGSLLRPPAITSAIDAIYAGHGAAWRRLVLPQKAEQISQLGRVADVAAKDFVRRQVEAGLDVVTDGEVRRTTFLSSLWDGIDGMRPPAEKIRAYDDGKLIWEGYADPLIDAPISRTGNPLLEEIPLLKASGARFKLTVPAPSYFMCDIVPMAEDSAYPSRLAFVQDVVEVEQELIAEAIAAGATWIQFDFPVYPALSDPAYAPTLEREHGQRAATLLSHAIDADRGATAGIPDDVTVAMHICRGNFVGGFWKGPLEPVAERMFNELPHERWLIEWEDPDLQGDFSALRHVPSDKTVALGLVSTKTPELESDEEIVRRLEEASNHLPLDRLALCPQCGFASSSHDKLVSVQDAQWRKLELVGRVADRVWGRD